MIRPWAGLSISGQTFYTFILENLERSGVLKAVGTGLARLRRILVNVA